MDIKLNIPFDTDDIKKLKIGDCVFLSGTIYSARDAAHKRMYDNIMNGDDLPFNLENNIIYYLGPTPAKENQVIGSAGPTTSSRMDKYTPLILDSGLKAMIGKGRRSKDVIESIRKNCAIYFVAIGGAGAYLSKRITSSKVIAYDDLGTEAVWELVVCDFPVIVAIDCMGNNLYELSVDRYKI